MSGRLRLSLAREAPEKPLRARKCEAPTFVKKKQRRPLCRGVRASPISYLWRGGEVASHACYTTVLPLLPLRARFRQKRAREQGSPGPK